MLSISKGSRLESRQLARVSHRGAGFFAQPVCLIGARPLGDVERQQRCVADTAIAAITVVVAPQSPPWLADAPPW
jgi:hypothetical protein